MYIYIWGWAIDVLSVWSQIFGSSTSVGKFAAGVLSRQRRLLFGLFLSSLSSSRTLTIAQQSVQRPKSKLEPLKSHFRFPGVYQVKWAFICCAQAWNKIGRMFRLRRWENSSQNLRRWENGLGGPSRSSTYLLKPGRRVEISRFPDGFSDSQTRPSK